MVLAATLLVTVIERWVLVPLEAEPLQLLVLVATVGGLARAARFWSVRYGVNLSTTETALATGNAAALYLPWQVASLHAPIGTAVFFALSLAAAFAGLLIAFTALMARVTVTSVPASFRGAPLVLIIAGLSALALLGLTGLLPD
jgi:electron transport complex protein RnfA